LADEPTARWRAGDDALSSPPSVGGSADEPAARWLAGDSTLVSGWRGVGGEAQSLQRAATSGRRGRDPFRVSCYQDTFIPSIARTEGRIHKTLGFFCKNGK
jgi:hypothetical protein